MFNRTLNRPMFRRGGSTGSQGTGITSGLQAPRQGYAGDDGSFVSKLESTNAIDNYLKNNKETNNFNLEDATLNQMRAQTMEAFPDRKRNNKDLFIDFGLDLVSRPGSGGSIFENIGASGQTAYNKYRDANAKREDKIDDRRSDLFSSLISAQGKIRGSDKSSSSYKDLEVAKALEAIMPRFVELKGKREKNTLEKGEDLELKQLQEKYNRFSAKNLEDDLLMEIYAKSLGDRAIPKKAKELYTADLGKGTDRKYTGKDDPQIKKDAVQSIRLELQSLRTYASGGRAGYANGELVEEQITETETMAPGPMDDGTNNLISYDQLRARLPNEVTDDIIELMVNSAESLEDFAMISSQQEVDQFNKKYTVNLVLPAEA